MNIVNNTRLLEHLASSHALGTLRGGARRRFEAIARENTTVRVAALVWQERWSSLTELQAAQQPSPNVWKRIENLLRNSQQAVVRELDDSGLARQLHKALDLWRRTAFAGGVAAVAAVLVSVNLSRTVDTQNEQLAQAAQQSSQLMAQLKATPDIQYVAVLADDKFAASMLVTVDTRNQKLVLKRVGAFQEAADKSLQLWALPPGSAPQSLGVLGGDKVMRLTAAEGQLQDRKSVV